MDSGLWSDAVLHLMADKGPRHRAVAHLLFPLPQTRRVEIVAVARQILPHAKGDWLDALRWVAAAAIAGAELRVFREVVAGRAWSLGTARYSGVAPQGADQSDTDW